ncbi:MAG: transposase, partial [Bacteroidetes bacterium]|nr:transposase [Bacteroidota bacterium]
MNKKNYLTAKAKSSIVLELLRGEDIETLSRKHQVTVAQLSQWRDDFINGGKQGFKKDPDAAKLKQAERLIGKLQMELELRKKKSEVIKRLKG